MPTTVQGKFRVISNDEFEELDKTPPAETKAVTELDRLADEIRHLLQILEQDVWEIGTKLAKAREAFGEDDKGFGQWCSDKLSGYNQRTLIRYRLLAEVFGNRQEEVEHIPQSALYELAAPKAEDVREKILERFEDAEKVTVADVKAAIAESKSESEPTPKELDEKAGKTRERLLKAIMALPPKHQWILFEELDQGLDRSEWPT